jgi:hypothetical protein
MSKKLYIMALCCGLLCLPSLLAAETWQELARHVGPAEGDRQEHIDQLLEIKDLDKTLIKAIGTPDQGLALDVISALKKKDLIPNLLTSLTLDDTGFLILTINVFIAKGNYDKIFKTYKDLLAKPDLQSPANIIAMLEPLGRLGEPIDTPALYQLIRHPFPEVRSAVIDYSRKMMFRYKNQKYHKVIAKAATDRTYQIQQQIESYLKELNEKPKVKKAISSKSLFKITTRKPNFKIDENDLRIFFGYKDARPGRFVGDRHERLALVQHLVEPCPEGDRQTCGFKRQSRDANLLLKKVSIEGSAAPIKIHLRLIHSSVSTDDEENRHNPYQKIMSEQAESSFLEGLEKADLVFYNGHSRFGGGPDFNPPLTNEAGYVDSKFYRTFTSGLTKMISALEKRKDAANMQQLDHFGMFSCASTQHFRKALKDVGVPNIITSVRLLHYAEALRRTEKQLNKFLQSLTQPKPNDDGLVSN